MQELRWCFLDEESKLLWDNGSGEKKEPVVTELAQLALKQPLLEEQIALFKSEIEKTDSKDLSSKIMDECGLTPDTLPQLVAHNVPIVTYLFQKLTDTPYINSYYDVLIKLDVSQSQIALPSMELVNELVAVVNVKKEYICAYISNCIKECENIKDPFFQTRLVRLLCVFVQKLLYIKLISIKDVSGEIETFCLEFSRIKEAQKLYQSVKKGYVQSSEISRGAGNENSPLDGHLEDENKEKESSGTNNEEQKLE
ncbi:hypothetical protein RFI_02717 [Reticulomyxa filosa]|uniref:CCR4-NOT transcription complex subunit 11 n=1 Tax=Reticulomyxa filosa TaxID=46433 RepID=X6P788_RETFI|nr:hypothetical protein RFI_02717 [Reticulomyxa filosa]|eukprot:ETO34370.1 hypothetical protein RFI_02717 [Reticulomyxa filosa]